MAPSRCMESWMSEKSSLAKLMESTRSRRDEEDFYGDDPGEHRARAAPPTTSAPAAAPQPASEPHRAAEKPSTGDRVHTSVYLPRDVWRRLRAIAAAEDCKVHDLVSTHTRGAAELPRAREDFGV
jgi:hypothetical protein